VKRLVIVTLLPAACGPHVETAAPVASGSPHAPEWHCAPPPRQPSTTPGTTLKAGEFSLTLVATEGPQRDSSVSGPLWLWPTSVSDSSPRTGKRAVATDTLRTPFYGATDVNFDAVGAPVFRHGPSDPTPSPDSRDPVYPGVLVFAGNRPGNSVGASATLVIGTLSNMRDGLISGDGEGIGLWVRAFDENAFVGDWSEWGIVRGGRGYFCLVPAP
jgi:hypothetical protein